jgi:cytochrome c553
LNFSARRVLLPPRNLSDPSKVGRQVRTAIAVLCGSAICFWAAPARTEIPANMAERVEACTPCHGKEGRGSEDVYFPRLGWKPAGYLYNQLLAFRSGRRKYPPMNYLLEFLPNEYLRAMAEFRHAESTIPRRGPVRRQQGSSCLRRDTGAQRRSLQGGAGLCELSRTLADRTGARGSRPARVAPQLYSAQLGAWRYGTRTAIAPDCMQTVAGRLTEDDVRAVAAFLASQPAPQNASPSPKGTFVLPFTCGSHAEQQ